VSSTSTIASWLDFSFARYDPESGQRIRDTYASIGKACFGVAGERLVLTVQMTNLVFVGIVYLVLMSSALHSLRSLCPVRGLADLS